jgi:hypothetical protein
MVFNELTYLSPLDTHLAYLCKDGIEEVSIYAFTVWVLATYTDYVETGTR